MDEIKIGYQIGCGDEVRIPYSHLVVTGLTQKSGKCLSGDDLIICADGRQISVLDAFLSKEILDTVSLNNEFKLVNDKLVNVFENGVKQLYEIKTNIGVKIKLTGNHPLLTINGWKTVDELNVDDYIAIPRNLNIIKSMASIPKSALKILGYMISEGSMTTRSAKFTNLNPLLIEDMNGALREYGLELYKVGRLEYSIKQINYQEKPFRPLTKREGKCGNYAYGYWRDFCNRYGLKPCHSRDKEIPSIIFKCNNDDVRIFLNRLFAGDGCYTKGKGIVSYASISKKLLSQVQHLLLRFGIRSRFNKKPELFISAEDTQKFMQEIGMFGRIIEHTQKVAKPSQDIIPIKIPTLKKYKDHWVRVGHRGGFPSREIMKRYALYIKDKNMLDLSESDVYWAKITEKNKIGMEMTYDVTTQTTGNLIVNDIFVHNTTTLQALIKRSGKKAIVFTTKIGEAGFTEGTIITPYFIERSDWEYTESLLSAVMKEKMKFERGWIVRVCEHTHSLMDVRRNIVEQLRNPTLNQISKNIYLLLREYLDKVLPQISKSVFSKTLVLNDGINIMDMEDYSTELQSLVIRSVIEEILAHHKNIIVVMPEAWKFLPQSMGNPCKHITESFIRQGATNGNYLWIDSQDIAGIDKSILKQVSTWVMGLQLERNEVEHTLDQIPLSRALKPKENDIMTLKIGQFYVCTTNFTKKTYVQPAWVSDIYAIKVATGYMKIDDLRKPEKITGLQMQKGGKMDEKTETNVPVAVEKIEPMVEPKVEPKVDMRVDMRQEVTQSDALVILMEKIKSMQDEISRLKGDIAKCKENQPQIFVVKPMDKINKDFLIETKMHIMKQIGELTADEKRVLKYIEFQAKGVKIGEINDKCLFREKVSAIFLRLHSMGLAKQDTKRKICLPNLKKTIEDRLKSCNATGDEMNLLYDHIIAELVQ